MISSPTLPVTGQSSDWIELAEAAKRSGDDVGHLRRLCRDKWLAEGKARMIEGGGQGGKRSRWQVREDADEAGKFARVKFPHQIGTDLSAFSEDKRREALWRRKVLADWRTAIEGGFRLGYKSTQITAQYLNHLEAETGRGITQATLYNWEKRWRAEGLVGLIDRRGDAGKAQQQANQEDPFFEEVRRLYLTPRKLKLTVCHEIATLKAEEKGWEKKSYHAARRFIDAIPKAVVLKKRFGHEAFVNEAEPYIERDYSALASNELWCGDHHQFDVIVNDNGKLLRPWITAWLDTRSRKLVGYQIFGHDPNGDTILEALRRGILDHGVPRGVTIDNGKDYDSYALNGRTKKDRWAIRHGKVELDRERADGIFAALDITANFCWAYHGQSKLIERFFGTVEQATPVWKTYCGNCPAEKPEDLQLNLERGEAPDLADFVAWFERWVAAYHKDAHRGDGMDGKSPEQIWGECLDVKRTAPRELLDVLMLKSGKPVKVGQNGVTYQGLRYGQYELNHLLGKEVILKVDDRDLNKVQVWSIDGKFLAVAHANAKVPANATAQELREAIASKRKATKFVKEAPKHRMAMAEDLPDLIVRARHAAAAAQQQGGGDLPTGPASIQPVRSPLEDQLPALRKALEHEPLKTAVGAESLSDVRAFLKDDPDENATPTADPFAALRDALKGGDL